MQKQKNKSGGGGGSGPGGSRGDRVGKGDRGRGFGDVNQELKVLLKEHKGGERGGLVVNASDSGSRGRGIEPHSGQTVLCPCARHIYSPKVLVIPRKWWLRPNMTEKLLTGTFRINHQHKGIVQY